MQKIKDIDLLRFPLALFVVMEHTLPQYMPDKSQYTLYLFFDAFLRGNSVPVFFFISGFLFFYNTIDFNTDIWRKKLYSRIHTLLIPYILWNIFAIIVVWITVYAGMEQYMANAKTFSPTILSLLKCFWMYDGTLTESVTPSTYPINVALWYVRNLIILCLIANIIFAAIKKNIIFTFAFCIAIWGITLDSSLFFFTLGAFFSIKRKSIIPCNRQYFLYSACAYILSGIAILLLPHNESTIYLIKQINIISFIPLAFTVANKVRERRITTLLSSASCLIYFAHQPICGKINKLMIAFIHPEQQATEFTINILAVATTVILLYSSYKIMNKYFPRTLYILTGK